MAFVRTALQSVLLASTLPGIVQAQISDEVQGNLQQMALDALNTSESMTELAQAAELLNLLGGS